MENQVYNWFVKHGNILIQKKEDRISLELNYENGENCLLTKVDANEVIDLLINLSQEIWKDPNYQKQPYTNHLFKQNDNEYYWETGASQIFIKYNKMEDAIEISYTGNNRINLEVNYVVEMVQIMEQLTA